MSKCDIVFIGPGESAQGGIAAVLANYRRTSFWQRYRCCLYGTGTAGEAESRAGSLAYQVGRVLGFLPFLWRKRPRCVSLHTSSRRSFYRSLVYLLLAHLAGIPVVLHIHPAHFAGFYSGSGALGRWLIRRALTIADQVVFLTEVQRESFACLFPARQFLVIPNPVDTARICPGEVSRAEGKIILFMGAIMASKGVYDIVQAMPSVLARHPDARFVFAGDHEVGELRNRLASSGLSHAADVPGWLTGAAKVDLLQRSSLLLLPSYSEGLPNVLLEGMAAGVPVITTPVGGIPAVAEHGRTAWFVRPGAPEEIAAAILTLLADEGLRATIATAAREHVVAHFGIERVGRMLEETYRRYLPAAAGAPMEGGGSRHAS